MDLIKRTPALRSIGAQSTPVSGTDSPTGPDMCSMDSLIREVATPRTRATLLEYEGESKVATYITPACAWALPDHAACMSNQRRALRAGLHSRGSATCQEADVVVAAAWLSRAEMGKLLRMLTDINSCRCSTLTGSTW